jgi:molybdopterin/thiamine biosynthesis adenylyltransferase
VTAVSAAAAAASVPVASSPAASVTAEAAADGPGRGTGALQPQEIERYARHLYLREIGGPGQQRLKAARVLVIGAGGLGAPALLYLAASGVGTIGVIDDDAVELSNLQRQVIHATDRLGQPKVLSAATALAALNPHVAIRPHHRRLDAAGAEALIAEYDLVLDGTDNFDTRYLVNRLCARAGKPLVGAALGQWEGQLAVWDPARGGPCYECVFPTRPAPGLVWPRPCLGSWAR